MLNFAGDVMRAMKEVFTVPTEKECCLWCSMGSNCTHDLLTGLDKHVFDTELINGQVSSLQSVSVLLGLHAVHIQLYVVHVTCNM